MQQIYTYYCNKINLSIFSDPAIDDHHAREDPGRATGEADHVIGEGRDHRGVTRRRTMTSSRELSARDSVIRSKNLLIVKMLVNLMLIKIKIVYK